MLARVQITTLSRRSPEDGRAWSTHGHAVGRDVCPRQAPWTGADGDCRGRNDGRGGPTDWMLVGSGADWTVTQRPGRGVPHSVSTRRARRRRSRWRWWWWWCCWRWRWRLRRPVRRRCQRFATAVPRVMPPSARRISSALRASPVSRGPSERAAGPYRTRHAVFT